MNGKKISTKMIAQMSKQSMKSSRMRNIFVMVTVSGNRMKDSFPTRSR